MPSAAQRAIPGDCSEAYGLMDRRFAAISTRARNRTNTSIQKGQCYPNRWESQLSSWLSADATDLKSNQEPEMIVI